MDFTGDISKLILSIILGAVVGMERELSEKPAGLKTNVLICLGSTIFTIFSLKFKGAGMDPARIAAQIVTGIGFLGAGAIMRDGEHVTGLTTAATIWVVAAIGLGVGMGYHYLAALASIGTLAVQIVLTRLDIVVDKLQQRHRFRVVTPPDDQAIELVQRIFRVNRIHIMRRKIMKQNNLYQSEWWTSGSPKGQDKVVRELLQSDRVIEVLY